MKMIIKNIDFDKQELHDLAKEIFMSILGLDREGRKYERMREEALRIRTLVQAKMSPLAEYRFYNDLTLQGECLTVNGTDIICGAFKQLNKDMLEGAYLYVVSSGEVGLPDAKAIEQLYADYWGNAYTDALRGMLKAELANTSVISDSFGPGFYGMDTGEVVKLGQLLDFEGKGISLKNGQLMMPQKSCTGIIFKINDNYKKIDDACKSCQGNHLNCRMCIVNRSR